MSGTEAGPAERSGDSVIRTEGLTKRYGRITAVQSLDLDVRAGDVFGFLGANGSGKTTTVRMLLGLVLATSGRMELLGQAMPRSARDVLPQVGAMVEGPAAYPQLSGRRNLMLLDASGPGGERATRRQRVGDVLEQVGLGTVDRRPVQAYSLGMRQRLGLAGALLRRPRLLVLDEPTNGLDPQGIHEIRELLLELNRQGTTVFLSSHLLGEIEQMCTRVAVLSHGRLVLQGALEEFRRPTGRVEVRTPDVDLARRTILAEGGRAYESAAVEVLGADRLLVTESDPAALNGRLVGAGVRVAGLNPEVRRLEDVVLEVTSRSAITDDGRDDRTDDSADDRTGDRTNDRTGGAEVDVVAS